MVERDDRHQPKKRRGSPVLRGFGVELPLLLHTLRKLLKNRYPKPQDEEGANSLPGSQASFILIQR